MLFKNNKLAKSEKQIQQLITEPYTILKTLADTAFAFQLIFVFMKSKYIRNRNRMSYTIDFRLNSRDVLLIWRSFLIS